MKGNSNIKYTFLILAVIYVVICIIGVTFTPAYEISFWTSILFLTLAYIYEAVLLYLIKSNTVQDYFFNINSYIIGGSYVAIQSFLSLVFMIFFVDDAIKFKIILQLILIAAFSIFTILSIINRDTARSVSTNTTNKKAFILASSDSLLMISRLCQERDLSKDIKKLSDIARYSEPSYDIRLSDIERNISDQITCLRLHVAEYTDVEKTESCIKVIKQLLEERNNMCRRFIK